MELFSARKPQTHQHPLFILPNPTNYSEVESPSPPKTAIVSLQLELTILRELNRTSLKSQIGLFCRHHGWHHWTGFLFKPVRRVHEKHLKSSTSICNRFLCIINDSSIRNHFWRRLLPLYPAFFTMNLANFCQKRNRVRCCSVLTRLMIRYALCFKNIMITCAPSCGFSLLESRPPIVPVVLKQ